MDEVLVSLFKLSLLDHRDYFLLAFYYSCTTLLELPAVTQTVIVYNY